MKTLKFLIAGFSVLIGIGVVGTGVTLGELYKTRQMVFEASQNADISANALENIYIESDVPVRIMPTQGKPRVEFEANGSGLMIPEPKYDLKVTSEEKTSYINLKETQGSEFYIFTNNLNMELVVYLPEADINTLKVTTNQGGAYYGGRDFSYTSKANIKELSLNVGSIDLDLNGSYNNIDIKAGSGEVDITSNTPAILSINGGSNVKLNGQLQEVMVDGRSRSNMSKLLIKSALEAKIDISNSYADTVIEGKVKEIAMRDQGGSVTVNSSTPYNISLQSQDNVDATLKGMINTAAIEGYSGCVRLYPTGTPKRIEVSGENIGVNAVLPQDISGFEIKKVTNGYNEEEYGNNSYIDFEVKSENITDQLRRIYYGDEAMKMFINSPYSQLRITK